MNEQITIPEQIKQLIAGHLSGSLTIEELKILKKWLDESSEHKRRFNEIRYAWAMADPMEANCHQEKNVLKLSKRIKQHHHTIWTWQRIAAMWAVVFIGSWILYRTMYKTDDLVETKTIVASSTTIHDIMGSQSIVDMPDESQLSLNDETTQKYPSDVSAQNRQVALHDKACFQVAHSDISFSVVADDPPLTTLTPIPLKPFPISAPSLTTPYMM